MSGLFREMKWEESISDGNVRCSGDCKGALIPAGQPVHTRFGNLAEYPDAYPDDPTTFCGPCVTPDDVPPVRVALR